jgi:hypothetical protein
VTALDRLLGFAAGASIAVMVIAAGGTASVWKGPPFNASLLCHYSGI